MTPAAAMINIIASTIIAGVLDGGFGFCGGSSVNGSSGSGSILSFVVGFLGVCSSLDCVFAGANGFSDVAGESSGVIPYLMLKR